MVNRMHFVCSLFGQSTATMHRYVGLHSLGMSVFLMKNIVLVPCIFVSLFPCANQPILSAVSIIHSSPSMLVHRSQYSAGSPVSG